MALITKSPSWRACTTNFSGITPSSSVAPGTGTTSGASNADGTAVASGLGTLAHDVEYLVIGLSGANGSATNRATLMDILIDPAGGTSWASLIDDLIAGQTAGVSTTQGIAAWYYFPLWIPAGATLGLRSRNAAGTTGACRATMFAFGGNRNPASWWCGQRVTSIGIDAANSQGANHTPGNSGVYSSWTDFGSTLPANAGAIQFGIGAHLSTMNALAYLMEFGVGGNIIGPPIYKGTGTTESGFTSPTGPLFCELPTGTQLQVRGTAETTAQALDVAAYAVH